MDLKNKTKQNHKTHLYAAYRRVQMERDTDQKVKGWKKTFHPNGNQKKSGAAILKPNKL